MGKISKTEILTFAEAFVNSVGGTYTLISDDDDAFVHAHFAWTDEKGNLFVFFVRKFEAQKENPTEDVNYRWIEFEDNKGERGWARGSADFIVFEGADDWLIVRKKKLLKVIDDNMIDKSIVSDRSLWFRFYRGAHGKGRAVRVPLSLIRHNADRILIKRNFIEEVTGCTKSSVSKKV